jgi:hypothetical protein
MRRSRRPRQRVSTSGPAGSRSSDGIRRLRSLMRSSGRGVILKSIQRSTGSQVRNPRFHGDDHRGSLPEPLCPWRQTSFRLQQNFDAVVFFTDTLEFVFATSDLIEAGWDVKAWSKTDMTMSHTFGRYLVTYAEWLQDAESSPAVNAARTLGRLTNPLVYCLLVELSAIRTLGIRPGMLPWTHILMRTCLDPVSGAHRSIFQAKV